MGKCLSKDADTRKNRKKSAKIHPLSELKIPESNSAQTSSDLNSFLQDSSSYARPMMTSSPYNNNNTGKNGNVRGGPGPSRTVSKNDRVVWMDDSGQPEIGSVKWIGKLDNEPCLGLQLDKKRTVSFGPHTGKKLFSCKPRHRAVVPLCQVILLKDFEAEKAGYVMEYEYDQVNPPKDKNSKRKKNAAVHQSHDDHKHGFKKPKVDEEIPSTFQQAVVMRKRVPSATREPDWSHGDTIKFRDSKEEAEILETNLEGSNLMMKIKYTDESSRPGQVQSSPLVDIMAASNLVVPPILHQSLRRNSFLEAVSPSSNRNEHDKVVKPICKDESVQTSTSDLREEVMMLPPKFIPSAPPGFYQSEVVQTSVRSTSSSIGSGPAISPSLLGLLSNQSTVDVVDYTQPWSDCNPDTEKEEEFTYSGKWTQDFRKSQKDAAKIGAIKMKEQKLKFEKSLSTAGTADGDGDASNKFSYEDVDTKCDELDKAFQSSVSFNVERPLESPSLVKNLCRRNTYPLPNASPSPFSLAHGHTFSKQKMEYFGMNYRDEKAKVIGVDRKSQAMQPPVVSNIDKTFVIPNLATPEVNRDSYMPVLYSIVNTTAQVPQKKAQTAEARDEDMDTADSLDSMPIPSTSTRKRKKICRPNLRKTELNVWPPFTLDDIRYGLGPQKGISGMMNSCYLDATLFSMFYCTDVFDKFLFIHETDAEITKTAKKSLRCILTHLRGAGLCEGAVVMKLRNIMTAEKVKGHFMDVEDFMFNLFENTLKLPEFIHYYPDTKDFLTQLLIEINDPRRFASLQDLLETSFKMQDIKLVSVPSPAWIIEMPRSNGRLVQYEGIIPTLHLNMTELIRKDTTSGNNGSTCFCESAKLPLWSCKLCKEKVIFCTNCKDTLINTLHEGSDHLPYPVNHKTTKPDRYQPIMELHAVICFRNAHYTTFVKCGHGPASLWIYFDSLAAPSSMVEEVPEVNDWLLKLECNPRHMIRDKKIPARVKQMITDSHIYIYCPTIQSEKSTAL